MNGGRLSKSIYGGEVDVVREIGRSEVSRLKGSHKGPVE